MARPRSEEARQAALGATVDLLIADGTEAVTFDEVAARSGVAKTTLYRHFGSKQAMLVEAAQTCFVPLTTPDTGDLLEDLRLLFQSKASASAREAPDLIPALAAAGDRDPELRALLQAMHEERRRPVRIVLQLAQLRGEIGRDVDIDVAMSMVIGPFVMRRMIDRLEVTPDFLEQLLREVTAVLRSTAHAPVSSP